MSAPVLLLVFNRPEATARVFEAVRRARPEHLYVAADGPRAGRAGEAARCEAVRAIVSRVDWPCKQHTLYQDENLGCKRAVGAALDWFFAQESEGIVLEDDCLPDPSFFRFCAELLERYRADTRVWQICGTAFLERAKDTPREHSYFFSRYGPVWGWASWRRAWQHADPDLAQWPTMRAEPNLRSAYPDRAERAARHSLGERLFRGQIDTWDYQWGMVKKYHSGLSVIPGRNLVVNIGFAEDATHTRAQHPLAARQSHELEFPLRHPPFVLADSAHDDLYRRELVLARPAGLRRWPAALLRRLRRGGRR
jgi:hypothetical protein